MFWMCAHLLRATQTELQIWQIVQAKMKNKHSESEANNKLMSHGRMNKEKK